MQKVFFGFLAALGVGTLSAQQAPEVVGVATFLHIVSNFDQSVDFYHNTLGLEFTGHAVPPKPLDSPPVANMYGVPGQQYRAAVLKVPGTSLNIEFVQWGPTQQPRNERAPDPGVVTLILRRMDAANAGKTLLDLDGFPIQVVQSDNPGADLTISVSDVKKTAGIFTQVLGFKPDGDWFNAPGGSVRMRLTKAAGNAASAIPFPTPGRASIRLTVHDISAMTAKLTGAGLTSVTIGGAPVTLPYNGPRAIILREPSSFALQLVEAK